MVSTQVIGGVSTMAAVFLFLAFVARHVGTWLQDTMFSNGDRFPTTLLLLDTNSTLSGERKQQIRIKLKAEFDVDLLNHTSDTAQSRQRIGEAVSHIRKKFFGKSGLVLQRNIEFGIAKNVAGGSIISLNVSLIIVVISFLASMADLLYLGLIMLVFYVILVVFGIVAMRTNARRYATILFEEYLAS